MLRLSQGPRYCLLTIIVGTVLAILAVAISAASSATASAPAVYDILYVAPGADCGGVLPCYSTLQAALDAAGANDTIKIAAGVYTDIHSRPAPAGYSGSTVITQVAYISKTLAIQGGYTLTNWSTPNPISYPTTLDGQRHGRVLFITGAVSPTIGGVQIVGGNAAGLGGYVTLGGSGPYDAGGGAYIAMGADGTMGNNHVFSNTAEYGGGLFLFNSPTVLEGNIIQSNIATGEGGGVLVQGYGNEAILNHNHINSNTAMLGGGLCIDNSSAVINANTIQGNKAMNGGGVGIYYATAVLTDNIISSNIATGGGMFASALGGSSGGGVHLYKSYAVLSGNVVDSNSSSAGGGLHLYESNVTLNENVVTCNAAVSNGGGLWLTRSSVTLGGNTISGNTAGYHGGGLDAVRSSATIVNNVITRLLHLKK